MTSPEDLAQYGVGLELYFHFYKYFGTFMFICGIITFPTLCFCLNGTQGCLLTRIFKMYFQTRAQKNIFRMFIGCETHLTPRKCTS